MDPIFTIPYPEFAVASQLSRHLPPKLGYSIFVPASRQQKGVDLLITHREAKLTRALAVQVKSSRTYSRDRESDFRYYTWYNNFDVPAEADFVFLIALFPEHERVRNQGRKSWWTELVLVFSQDEMAVFLQDVKTVGGKRDRMFGFGFDTPARIVQTRGDQNRNGKEFTPHLLKNRVDELRLFLAGDQ